MWIYILIAVVVVIALWFIGTYNGFIKRKGVVDEAFAGMDVYLKKRYDLIPNLVETVKTYMSHEQDTLTKIVELRSAASDKNASMTDRVEADNQLSGALTHLFALSENYPELKASEQFLSLQNQLTAVETDIAEARKYYNGAAKLFNVKVRSIPSNLVANMCGFRDVPYFEVTDAAERENVKVDFGK